MFKIRKNPLKYLKIIKNRQKSLKIFENLPKTSQNPSQTLPKSHPNPNKSKEIESAAAKTKKVWKK